jgi:hypothetical protein
MASPRTFAMTSVSDEQASVDTLPEGLPISFSGELIDVSADDLAELTDLPTGEGASESSLPSRSRPPFDEETTRKQHAPKPPPRELTDVSEVHELFKDWDKN